MGNVIGPIKPEDWLTLLMLKRSLSVMKKRRHNGKFEPAIKKETELYKGILNEYKEVA